MLDGKALDNFLNGNISGFSREAADLEFCKWAYHLERGDPREIDRKYRRWEAANPDWDKPTDDGLTYGKKIIIQAINSESGKAKSKREKSSHQYEGLLKPGLPLTDAGNAKRLAVLAQHDFKFVLKWNKWIKWTGKKWEIDDGKLITQLAILTARKMVDKAQKMEDKDREAFIKHALRSEGGKQIAEMVKLAATFPFLQIMPDKLDTNTMLFNCQNGTLNLKTGELQEHRRGDFLTQISPVSYDPAADCPNWIEHLKLILKIKEPGKDEENEDNRPVMDFLQNACGYGLTGLGDERCLFILWGKGRNGKSTTVETLASIYGDYARRAPVEMILTKFNDPIPSDLAALKGRRFAFTAEIGQNRKLDESKIKDITGQDTITARYLRKEWFTFKPHFKLWISTNHKPIIHGTDDAIWDRIRLIEFTYRFPEDKKRPMSKLIEEKFKAEFPGILNWMLNGLKDYKTVGHLFTPDAVKKSTEEYRREEDLIGNFLSERCETGKDFEATTGDLYEAYREWCDVSKEKPISKNQFGKTLAERNFIPAKIRRERGWKGIKLQTWDT